MLLPEKIGLKDRADSEAEMTEDPEVDSDQTEAFIEDLIKTIGVIITEITEITEITGVKGVKGITEEVTEIIGKITTQSITENSDQTDTNKENKIIPTEGAKHELEVLLIKEATIDLTIDLTTDLKTDLITEMMPEMIPEMIPEAATIKTRRISLLTEEDETLKTIEKIEAIEGPIGDTTKVIDQ